MFVAVLIIYFRSVNKENVKVKKTGKCVQITIESGV